MKRKMMCLGLLIAAACSLTVGPGILADSPSGADNATVREAELDEQSEPCLPVPESEMTRITFSMDWLVQNDTAADPWTVTIVFPEKWTKESPKLASDEKAIELVVPTRLLRDHNSSKKDGELAVTFPSYYFNGFPLPEEPPSPPSEKPIEGDSKAMDYVEREWYQASTDDPITGASGRVRPSYYYNPYDQDSCAYQEIEFHTDTYFDVGEIIVEFGEDEEDTKVWFEILNNNNPVGGFECEVEDVDIDEWVNYELYFDYDPGGWEHYWMCWLEYPEDTWYYDHYTDSSNWPEEFIQFAGSSELKRYGEWTDEFWVECEYLRMQHLQVDGEWEDSDEVHDRIEYDERDPASHVQVIDNLYSNSGLRFETYAYN